jgi:hypothetical protein
VIQRSPTLRASRCCSKDERKTCILKDVWRKDKKTSLSLIQISPKEAHQWIDDGLQQILLLQKMKMGSKIAL